MYFPHYLTSFYSSQSHTSSAFIFPSYSCTTSLSWRVHHIAANWMIYWVCFVSFCICLWLSLSEHLIILFWGIFCFCFFLWLCSVEESMGAFCRLFVYININPKLLLLIGKKYSGCFSYFLKAVYENI